MATSPLELARCTVLGTRRVRSAGDVGQVVRSGAITTDVASAGTCRSGRFGVVVYGAIENRDRILRRLERRHRTTHDTTDAEIVAQLIEQVRSLVPDLALAVQVVRTELGHGWAAVVAEHGSTTPVVVSEGPALRVDPSTVVEAGHVLELAPVPRWWRDGVLIPHPSPEAPIVLPARFPPSRIDDVA